MLGLITAGGEGSDTRERDNGRPGEGEANCGLNPFCTKHLTKY